MTSGRGTRPGVTFTYSIKKSNRTGRETDELLISRKENSKTITRSTVEMAFENALEIQRTKRICKVDTKRTHSIEGVGLGLSICSQLLERMDSKLCVKSTYNEGSVFSFVLEQEVIDETPIGIFDLSENISEIKLKESNIFTFSAPECRILVVDDTPLNLQVISGLLRQTSMRIDEAESGEECLEKM